MEQIAVIANSKEYAIHMAKELELYFKDYAEFYCYDMSDIMRVDWLAEKYVVLSSFTIFQRVKEKTKESTKIIIIDLTLNRHAINRLNSISADTKALLVSIDYRNCMETITMIYNLGFKMLELIPYYPGCSYDDNIKVAITTGELKLVPNEITLVVDIEQRCIDKKPIYEIAKYLNVEDPFESDQAKKFEANIISFNTGFDRLINKNSNLMEQLSTILKLVPQGIILTDTKGKMYMSNNKAKSMLKSKTEIIDGFNITEVFPQINDLSSDGNSSLVKIHDRNIIVTKSEVITNDEHSGDVITLEYFKEAEEKQHKFRKQISGYTHKAAYTFEKIIGNSEVINNAKSIAARMASSELNVCLIGESGTGKELFAQSIHNSSTRKNYNFVAVNCSALPETLLESELYGYEEGAFSGAKKGGKIGLFELAHNGTLFLDEIGELPLRAQPKLLRAIEEKKIMRIGGNDLIDVDVRIICATNRDLLQMVEDREFRSDLYYRLSVLPIKIPPLRERKEDILTIMNEIRNNIQGDYTLDNSAKECIVNHAWPGNVRELKNITEYITNLGKPIIKAEDLPFMSEFVKGNQYPLMNNNKNDTDNKIENKLDREQKIFAFIFEEIENYKNAGLNIGRRTLLLDATRSNLGFSESEIRLALTIMKEKGYIVPYKGRRGSEITEKGKNEYRNIK